jgi:hypothetical protein
MHAGNCVCRRCDLRISANWPRGGQFSASGANFGNQREKVPTAVRYFISFFGMPTPFFTSFVISGFSCDLVITVFLVAFDFFLECFW